MLPGRVRQCFPDPVRQCPSDRVRTGAAGSRPCGGADRHSQPAAAAPRGSAAITTVGSLNWAGYAVSKHGVSFTSVRASFFVPYLNCGTASGATLSSAWAGLDGYLRHSDSVEQAGVAANCSSTGQARYFAWSEMFPYPEVRLPLAVRPGDHVSITVSYQRSRRVFDLVVSDNTSGRKVSRVRPCPGLKVAGHRVTCPRSSAEVVAEAPETGTSGHLRIAPLTDYGAFSFSGIAITGGASTAGLLSRHWNTTRILQVRGASGPLVARPTPLAAGLFADYWLRPG